MDHIYHYSARKSRLFQPFAIFCCLAITMRPLVDASKIKGKGAGNVYVHETRQ